MSNAVYLFNLLSLAVSAAAAGYAWGSSKRANLALAMTRKAVGTATEAHDAATLLAMDIDAADKRADEIYATLERHEKTFARSRRSRTVRPVENEVSFSADAFGPKAEAVSGVNDFGNGDKE